MDSDKTLPMPLDGVRVIDFSQVMMGPCCTQMLGDYGADVIKIERGPGGDLSRWSLGSDPDGLNNPVFCSLNRNKRSVVIDLKSENGKAQVLELIEGADVVVNNFRMGVMGRIGLGWDFLSELNPRLIYAEGTGFGTEGPYSHKGGQDVLAQAMAGGISRRASESLPLSIYPIPVADYAAGMHMFQGILLALLQREKTGHGQKIEVTLYSSMLAMQMQEAASRMMRDKELNWAALPLTGVFETADSALVMVGAFKENPLREICKALEIDDLSAEERFANLDRQAENRDELQQIFRDNYRRNTTAHWLARLEEVDILSGPVISMAEALAGEHVATNHMILELEPTKSGPVRLLNSPIKMSAAPVAVRHQPPQLGAHSDEVLGELQAGKAG